MNSYWKQMKLIDVIQKTETINPQKTPNASFEYIDVSSICNKRFAIQEISTIFGKDAPSRARKLVRTGDILFATVRPTLKRIAQVPKHLDGQVCSTGYFVFRPKDFVEEKFLFYFLFTEHFMGAMEQLQKGASYPAVNDGQVSNQTILIPPLPEQKRIVAILDEAFEGIDRAIANAEKNLANARKLFESYLNAIFTQKGDGWEEKKLGDIATFRNGLNFTKSSKGESIKIVGVKDFQNHFWIQEAQLDSVTIDAELKEIDILRKGDILTVRSNGNKELIGRCVLAGEISEKTSHSGFTIRIRIKREGIYPQFIVHFLKSRELRKQLTESGGGISISSLNQQGLSLIIMSFPTFVEQKAIVANIDELAVETQRLESIYRKKIAALNELKQSILQKAFTGELTADTANQTTKAAKEGIAA